MALLRTKLPAPNHTGALRKCLTAGDLTFLGIGNMIGTGIFVLTGVVAATQAGPAVILSFVLAGVVCGFVAFAYAELASSVGGCGGPYGYAYAAFGKFPAWIVAWNMMLAFGTACAAVANGWSGYFDNALTAMGIHIPRALTRGPAAGGIVNLPAAAIVLLLMAILFRGIKDCAAINRIIVFIKLAAIAIFIVVAFFHADTALWHPFMPYGWFGHRADGKTIGVLAGASVVFFAYRGFHSVSMAIEEARNPQRDMPIGIIGSLTICTIIYLIVSGLLNAIAPYDSLNVSSPVAFALLRIGFRWGSALVAIGIIIGLTSTMLAIFYVLTRLLFALGRDGLLPSLFARLNPKTQVPSYTTALCGVIISAAAGLLPLGALAELVNAVTLIEFMLICIGALALRTTRPDIDRPFRAPGGVLTLMFAVVSCGALLSFLPLVTLLRFGLYLATGIALYFIYVNRGPSRPGQSESRSWQ